MPNAVNVVFAIALVSRVLVSKFEAMGYLQKQHMPRGPMSQEQVDLIKMARPLDIYTVLRG